MILILRGHIRNSFNNLKLYNLINQIYEMDQNIKIYIHTWNIFSNNISWRQIESNNTPVTEEIIYNYFNDLKHLIKHIIIDDDTNINLIGNIEGTINNGATPLLGWKNYWYGKYQIINYIYNISTEEELYNTKCINMRFDLLDLTAKYRRLDSVLIYFIKDCINYDIKKNIFTKNFEDVGIDDIYIGNIDTMFKLSNHFFYFLDDILLKYTDNIHQEYFVFRENNVLFPEIIVETEATVDTSGETVDTSGETGDTSGATDDDISGATGDDISGATGDDISGATGDDISGATGGDISGATGDDISGATGGDISGATGDASGATDDTSGATGDTSGATGDDTSGATGDTL